MSKDNIFNVLRQGSVVGVLAIGMTFVIATAGIDLSVGSMVAATGVAGGMLVDSTAPSLAFVLGALALGFLLGAVNGAAIAYGKVVPFIATLAMFSIARGLALWMQLTRRRSRLVRSEAFSLRWFGTGEVLTIPSSLHRLLRGRGGRLGAAQSHPLWPLRRGGRWQPRGRADRRREGAKRICSACMC